MKATYIYAGAGSGKTYRLTHDLADMLTRENDPVDISRIILTTFTKAAAADFVRKAREVLINEKKSPAKAAELDSALIGTVHSVCERFVKKYWYRLGLTLPLNIISEEDKKLYVSRTAESIAEEKDIQFFYEFAREFKMNGDFWKDTLTSIIEKKYSFGISDFKESCAESCRDIEKVFSRTDVPDSSSFAPFLKTLISIVNADAPGKTQQGRIKELTEVLSKSDFRQAVYILSITDTGEGTILKKKNYWKQMESNTDIVGIVCGAERFVVSDRVGKRLKECVGKLFDLAEKWEQAYLDFKAKNRLLDFNDLEQKFLRILTEPGFADVRKDIADSYDVMMVDEFQDSNPIQIKIFRGLMCLVKEQAVFVGDSKQAIFGFRGTESTLVEDFVRDVGDKKSLRKSFRSRPSLVNAANDIFCTAFGVTKLPVDLDHDDAPYDTVSLKDVRPEHEGMMKASIQHWEAPLRSSRSTTSDYSAVGLRIREIKDSGKWMVAREKDKNGNEILEPIRYSDIAILLRKSTNMGDVAKRFREAGVPVSIQDSGFIAWAEVQLILALIRFVIDPKDGCARADVLHLVGGMTTENVIGTSLCHDQENGSALFERLEDIRERISPMSVSEIVDALALELNMYGNTEGWGLSETRTRNIDFMTGLARKYEQMCNGMNVAPTLPGYIDYVSNYNPEKDKQPLDKTDTVKVLTYHSSKGLEWPMVILDELGSLDLSEQDLYWKEFSGVCHFRPAGSDQVLLHVFPQILWTKLKDMVSSAPNLPQPILENVTRTDLFQYVKNRKVAEERRLLYVGFTRAKDYLITLGNEKCTYSWLTECNAGNKGVPASGCISLWNGGQQSAFCNLAEQESPESKEETVLEAWPIPRKGTSSDKYVSPSLWGYQKEDTGEKKDGNVALKELFHGEKMVQNIQGNIEGDGTTATGDKSALCGTCIHRIFAAFNPDRDRSELVAAASRIIAGMDLTAEFPSQESIVNSAVQFFGWLRKNYGDGTPLHELPFVNRQSDGTVIRGEMDLVWELPGNKKKCVLVDYKSFHGSEDLAAIKAHAVQHGYPAQLKAYKQMLETGDYKVIDVLIYYFIQGRVIRFEF